MSLLIDESTDYIKKGALISRRYEVLETLGVGGMGTVLKVKDRSIKNEVLALKIISPELANDRTQFGRFMNEVLLTRKLSHSHIVKLYDFGSTGTGSYFITMEYVRGGTLRDKIYVQEISFSEVCKIIVQMLSGLFLAHEDGVIHRDLKPDNILIDEEGNAKITDFGLARSNEVDKKFTITGETVGTPHYMSPEQLAGEELDGRADLYSLGIMAFEMVMQQRPFISNNYFELAKMHMEKPIPDILEKNPRIPSWYSKFVRVCCAKNKEQRFKTSDDAMKYVLAHVGPGFDEYAIPYSLYE